MSEHAPLPPFFEPLLAEQYGEEDIRRIVDGCASTRAVTLRVNTLKATRAEIAGELDAAHIGWTQVPWYEDAFIIDRDIREGAIRELDAYKEGRLYLQSLSSMIPALELDAQPGEDVCDLCAAPGGKTTQISALSAGKALVTACEMHAPRAEKLEFNLARQGAPNVTVMRTDARRLDDFFSFDRILLDAPCSGSGTLWTGDAKLFKRFTPALVEKSRKAQRALIRKALSLLKCNGTLVYSTCSVLACENEDIVAEALRQAPRQRAFELAPVALQDAESLPLLPTTLQGCLSLCPTNSYEGFFVAKIIRVR